MAGATVLMTSDDGSLPLREGETVADLLAERARFELDAYYPWLAPCTMETRFVEVSPSVATAWRKHNRGTELAAEETASMARLRDSLDEAIRSFKPAVVAQASAPCDKMWGAFVRLSTRSPKDAVDKQSDRLTPLVTRELARLGDKKGLCGEAGESGA